ncbi:phosphotransferase [Desulfovibrio inopinatus]|uniref:phosphotransferase n=1 Tax=Desulfovibrio inopinatus TaxID=102109 RepID=UPI0003FD0251|nr:phosphotransferase [Desulfovibrio inopinatus]
MKTQYDWSSLAGEPVKEERLVSKGRNSQVYRLVGMDGKVLLGKRYFSRPQDGRDRLAAELTGLRLVAKAGVNAPVVIATDENAKAVIMEFVHGDAVCTPRNEDIKQAVDFLVRINQPSTRIEATGISLASEACFSGKALEANLYARLGNILATRVECDIFSRVHVLAASLEKYIAQYAERARCALQSQGKSWDEELTPENCVLSPSDFGFHNALRRPDGSLCFLDFEYFGWDDPAKTLCDFVQHPAMHMNTEQKTSFIRLFADVFGHMAFTARAREFFPLFRLKWCFIFLNEFVAQDRARREFAGCLEDSSRDAILEQQLGKSQKYMETLHEKDEWFRSVLA